MLGDHTFGGIAGQALIVDERGELRNVQLNAICRANVNRPRSAFILPRLDRVAVIGGGLDEGLHLGFGHGEISRQ